MPLSEDFRWKKINRLINKNRTKGYQTSIEFFDSITSILVETSLTDKDEIDLFLKEYIARLIKYEHIVWLGASRKWSNKFDSSKIS
ncbi:MAG: hypothetical protein HYX60_05560 [Legionella longbeachae]|nr:hypothetical protein [Legionella longbeachae]